VLTDTIGLAYIYDVITREDHRKQGLGCELIEETLNHSLMNDVKMVELVCHDSMCEFYHKFGFSADYQDNRVPMRLYK
jgi:predicted GNAT family N-acyltransferase